MRYNLGFTKVKKMKNQKERLKNYVTNNFDVKSSKVFLFLFLNVRNVSFNLPACIFILVTFYEIIKIDNSNRFSIFVINNDLCLI